MEDNTSEEGVLLHRLRDRAGLILKFIEDKIDDPIKIVAILTAQEQERLDGYTPLHLACSEGNIVVLNAILDFIEKKIDDPIKIVEILAAKDMYGYTPLHLACSEGNIGVVNAILKFIEYKIDDPINIVEILAAKDKEGKTPLNIACMQNNSVVVNAIKKLENKKKAEKIKQALLLIVLLGVSIFTIHFVFKSMPASSSRAKKKKTGSG